MTREWAFLLYVKREWGFIFSVIRESIYFRPRETGFRLFRDPWNMHFRVIFEPTTFARIIFHFFLEILAPLKFVNYTKLDVKPAHSMSLRMELGLRTNHSNGNLEGLESAIMDKSREPEESWDKFALLAFLRTRQTLIQPLLPNLAPTPHTMLKTTTCNFFWFPGKIVFEGRGKVTRP